ncbi:hypothetical protein, partial [Pseudomonas syringae]|uniref:hypothetical protein n=1 Tax=Pseudomonas syringae TaxID=317 RepID=UPI001C556A52
MRGWHFAVHRVHASALGYSLLPQAQAGVKGYNHLLSEDGVRLSSRSLIFNTPLATSDWNAALKTDLRAIQISSVVFYKKRIKLLAQCFCCASNGTQNLVRFFVPAK